MNRDEFYDYVAKRTKDVREAYQKGVEQAQKDYEVRVDLAKKEHDMTRKLTIEDLEKIRAHDFGFREQRRQVFKDIARQFGIPERMLEDPDVVARIEATLENGIPLAEPNPDFWNDPVYVEYRKAMEKAIENRDTVAVLELQRQLNEHVSNMTFPPPPLQGTDVNVYRKDWEYMEIHPQFLTELRDGMIELVGKNALAFTMNKVKGPQGEELVDVIKGVRLSPRQVILFIEAHLTHLGVALVGSTGTVYEGPDFLTFQITLAGPVRLPPEVLSVTPDSPCPEPELTLFCDGITKAKSKKARCGFKVIVPETEAPARVLKGCPMCGAEELRYELCAADGTSLTGNLVHDQVLTNPNIQKAQKLGQLNDKHGWLRDSTWSTHAVPQNVNHLQGAPSGLSTAYVPNPALVTHSDHHDHSGTDTIIIEPDDEEDPMDEIIRRLS